MIKIDFNKDKLDCAKSGGNWDADLHKCINGSDGSRFKFATNHLPGALISILKVGLIALIIFGIATLLSWLNGMIGAWFNMPLIDVINPDTIYWYHYFDLFGGENSINIYYYAMFVYHPSMWWAITNITNIIGSIIFTIVLLMYLKF